MVCLSYFLKTNIKFYYIYQYFMSINSFFNTVSVSRYSRPITVTRDPDWQVPAVFFLIMLFKNPTGRRAPVREFITRQTCKICDYTVDYTCRTKTSKSPHAFAMCSIRTDLLKQENEKIDSL